MRLWEVWNETTHHRNRILRSNDINAHHGFIKIMTTQQATQDTRKLPFGLCLKKTKQDAWELWIDESIFYGTTKTDVLKQLEAYTQEKKKEKKLEKREKRFYERKR